MSAPYRVDIVEAVPYTETDDGPLLLDLYRPVVDRPCPVTLYLHGGAWFLGDRTRNVAPFARGLAERGVAVAGADYRLGPAGVFPRNVDDVRAAVTWLRRNGADHGLAVDRIGSWGASAGGHLSLMAALGAREPDGADRIDAVVDCYGPTDLPARIARTPLEAQLLRTPPDVAYLDTDPEHPDAERARAASPLYQDLRLAPPVLIVHGDRDQQMSPDQSVRLHQALVAAGATSRLLLLGGAGHEDPAFEQPWVLDATAGFLHQHLGTG